MKALECKTNGKRETTSGTKEWADHNVNCFVVAPIILYIYLKLADAFESSNGYDKATGSGEVSIHWGVETAPPIRLPAGSRVARLRKLGVSLRTNPASSGKDEQRVPAMFTEPEYLTWRIG